MTMRSCMSKIIKLFANPDSMEFMYQCFLQAMWVALSLEDLKGKPIFLKFMKFQNVCSLTIFIEENQESMDMSKVSKIAFYGSMVEFTTMKRANANMEQIQKLGELESYLFFIL
ncbi:hypothetical protein L7F22_051824 [Adiantum nelumboides]|nr:hypothetical protein [Adiantum nelumboides]